MQDWRDVKKRANAAGEDIHIGSLRIIAFSIPEELGQGSLQIGHSSFAVIALGGVVLRQRGLLAHTGGAVAAALLFYAVTNFGVWAAGVLYPADASGLLASYAAGLPFLWKTLAGNVFFTVLFFAVFQLVERYQPHTQSTESR